MGISIGDRCLTDCVLSFFARRRKLMIFSVFASCLVGGLPAYPETAHRLQVEVVPSGAPPDTLYGIAIERQGRRAVVASTNALRIWDLERGAIIRTIDNVGQAPKLLLTPDGDRVITVSDSYPDIKLWDLRTGALLRTYEVSARLSKMATALAPDGRHLFISGGAPNSSTGIGEIVNLETGSSVQLTIPIAGTAGSLGVTYGEFSPDGQTFLGANLCDLAEFRASDGKLIRQLRVNYILRNTCLGSGIQLSWGTDGNELIEARDAGLGTSRTQLIFWDLKTGKQRKTINFDYQSSSSNTLLMPLPDQRYILIGSRFGTTPISVLDLDLGRVIEQLDAVFPAALFDDRQAFLAADHKAALQHTVRLKRYDVNTRKELSSINVPTRGSSLLPTLLNSQIGIIPAGKSLISWDFVAGKVIRQVAREDDVGLSLLSMGLTNDESAIALQGWQQDQPKDKNSWPFFWASDFRLIKLDTGELLGKIQLEKPRKPFLLAAKFDGRRFGSCEPFGATCSTWDATTGALLSKVKLRNDSNQTKEWLESYGPVSVKDISPDLMKVVGVVWRSDFHPTISRGSTVRVWDSRGGKELFKLIDPDGYEVGRFDTGSKKVPAKITYSGQFAEARFSPDNTLIATDGFETLLSEERKYVVKLWDATSGKMICKSREFADWTHAFAFDERKARLYVGGGSGIVRKIDTRTCDVTIESEVLGRFLSGFTLTPDGRVLFAITGDGVVKMVDTETLAPLASLFGSQTGEWIALTPEGIFNASSPKAGDLLSIVRGYDSFGVDQIWQSLYSPDLVREKLAGDPSREYARASEVINLDKVLDSGLPPQPDIVSDDLPKTTDQDVIDVVATVTDKGGGIGRVEWRVNGTTTAISAKSFGSETGRTIKQTLALDSGENLIEVVAYNAANLVASTPAKTTVRVTESSDAMMQKLHVLAIGVNTYIDHGWAPPNSQKTFRFPPLNLAVKDATALAAELKQAGTGQYADVKVTLALDAAATLSGLQKLVDQLGTEIHPRDTFVLFAAAHGTSHNGRFYMIPQDYDGGPNPLALKERAIGQEQLQDWIVNRIKAKRVIVILDTCESGALVGGYTRSRVDVPASEAAIGRLHEATGRPVLTAAAEGQPAFEGYEGHGVFTWALLDALRNGDRNNNGTIELSELVAHVQEQVPTISAKLNGRGVVAVAARGSSNNLQSARFGSRGEDFALVRRLQ